MADKHEIPTGKPRRSASNKPGENAKTPITPKQAAEIRQQYQNILNRAEAEKQTLTHGTPEKPAHKNTEATWVTDTKTELPTTEDTHQDPTRLYPKLDGEETLHTGEYIHEGTPHPEETAGHADPSLLPQVEEYVPLNEQEDVEENTDSFGRKLVGLVTIKRAIASLILLSLLVWGVSALITELVTPKWSYKTMEGKDFTVRQSETFKFVGTPGVPETVATINAARDTKNCDAIQTLLGDMGVKYQQDRTNQELSAYLNYLGAVKKEIPCDLDYTSIG